MFKNLNTKILASIFLLICIVIIAATFTTAPFSRFAKALSSNYSKTTGSQLTVAEWNNLTNDFLDLTGTHAMQGSLNMGNHQITNLAAPIGNNDVATKLYVDSSSIQDIAGTKLKIVCGHTSAGSTGWQPYSWNPHAVTVTVNTSSAGFKSGTTPNYFAYILGSYSYLTTGTAVIYSPTYNSFLMFANFIGENNDFRVPALYGGTFITPSLAETFQWQVYWCGIGEPA